MSEEQMNNECLYLLKLSVLGQQPCQLQGLIQELLLYWVTADSQIVKSFFHIHFLNPFSNTLSNDNFSTTLFQQYFFNDTFSMTLFQGHFFDDTF